MVQLSIERDVLLPGTEPIACGPSTCCPQPTRSVHSQRKHLLAALRGQQICIPDLRPLFAHWPIKTNEHVDLMRQDIRQWLNETVPPGKTLTGLQASDFGHFGATWWPCASFDKLRIVTYLAVWLFIWDDEIDLADGAMWNEFSAAQSYREQTVSYVRYSLGIDEERPDVANPIILNFEPIGAAVRQRYTLEQCEMFLKEMVFFMDMSEQEQRLRLSGSIASLEEFWRYRLGSSAVMVCLALNEFSWEGMDLPTQFYFDEDVQALFRYTNTIISAVNDLLSIKKEIKREAIDSLIPILFFQIHDIQLAVEHVVAFVRGEIANMDRAAESLFAKYSDANPAMQQQVHDFVDGCKYYITGNLVWSLETDRYGVKCAEGDIVMML